MINTADTMIATSTPMARICSDVRDAFGAYTIASVSSPPEMNPPRWPSSEMPGAKLTAKLRATASTMNRASSPSLRTTMSVAANSP